jgi:short-subunit dehydrogenase
VGIALVTGASSGIGKALARCFAADGHDVALVARRLPLLETLASELSARHGRRSWAMAGDLSSSAGVESLLAELQARGLEIDFLVNNAGVGTTGRFVDSPLERELAMTELNVTAIVHLTRALLPGMLARGRGRVLNIGSTAGFQPGPYMATYYASKAFVNHFSEALFEELRGTGVTVTLSCPGPTQTEFGDVSGVGKSNLFRLPVATAEGVAREAYGALFAGRALIVHGFLNRIGAVLVRFGWRSLVRRIIAFLNRPAELGGKT